MSTISLCTGAGGLEMGLHGAPLMAYAEIDPAAIRVLEHLYPGVHNLGDITTWPSKLHLNEPVERILAGIPCPAVSEGGLKRGAADPRWLGAAFISHVAHYRPWEVFLENVEGLTAPRSRPELEGITGGLEKLGYSVRWGLMGACAAGAPHCRHRFYLHAVQVVTGNLWEPSTQRVEMPACQKYLTPLLPSPRAGDGIRGAELSRAARTGTGGTLADAVALGWMERATWEKYRPAFQRWEMITGMAMPAPWEQARTASGVRLSADFSRWLMGWPDGHLDGLKRADALRIAGNGVVPQAAGLARLILAPTHSRE